MLEATQKRRSLILIVTAFFVLSLASVGRAVEAAPSAQLKFYSDKNGRPYTEITGAGGGKVWLVLEMMVPAGVRVDPQAGSMVVRLCEDTTAHPVKETYVDISFELWSASLWEIWNGKTWSAAERGPARPSGNSQSENDKSVRYRSGVLWQTTRPWLRGDSRLLGHNGLHVASVLTLNGSKTDVRIPLQRWEKRGWGTANSLSVFPARLEIKNLAIAEVSPQDYLIVGQPDPKTAKRAVMPPVLEVKLEDNDAAQPVAIEVTLRRTSDAQRIVRTLRLANVTGNHFRLRWDGCNDAGSQVWSGFYTFDVKVVQPADGDECTYRSKYLYGKNDDFEMETEADGAVILDQQGRGKVRATYELSELPAPGSVTMRLFDLSGRIHQTAGGLSDRLRDKSNPLRLFALFPDFTKPGGSAYQDILTARDARGYQYRDHRNRPMLARG